MKDGIIAVLINNIKKYPPRKNSIIEGVLHNGAPRYDSPQCQPVFIEYPVGYCWIIYFIYIRGGAPYYDWDLAEQDPRIKTIFENGEFFVSGMLDLNRNINGIPRRVNNLRFISRELTNLKYGEKGWHPPKEYDSECGNWVIKPHYEGMWGLFRVRNI